LFSISFFIACAPPHTPAIFYSDLITGALVTPPSVILFDFDGTLCQSLDTNRACLQASFVHFALPCPSQAVLESFFASGQPIDVMIDDLVAPHSHTGITGTEVFSYYRKHYIPFAFEHATLYPGCVPTLTALRKHSELVVVSNHHQDSLHLLLDHFRLLPFFSAVHGCTAKAQLKPSPWFFDQLIAPVYPKLKPHDFLMVGDTSADIGFARACGMPIALARYGYGNIPASDQAQLDYTFDTLPSLLDIVSPTV
jgi:phosphoglycolate phosphatase